MRKRFWKGLRTIDFIIVLSIICMVLWVVVKHYDDFKCRSMQSEAKFSLQQIHAAQLLFHKQNDHYAPLHQLNEEQRILLTQRYYTFSDFSVPTKDSFSVIAEGVNGALVAGEQWTINESKKINIIKPICNK
jgi:Tfp pilus assembly protein PilE